MNGDAQQIYNKIGSLETRVATLEAQTEERHEANLRVLEKIEADVQLIFLKFDYVKKEANEYTNRTVAVLGVGGSAVIAIICIVLNVVKGG